MKPIAIYGAGSFGREVLMLIRQINDHLPQWKPIGFFDDNMMPGDVVSGLSVLGDMSALNAHAEPVYVILAVGNSITRKKMASQINNASLKFATLVHPNVQLADYQNCEVGKGSIIAAGNILTVDIKIGKHAILNIASTFGHDSVLEDFVSVMPGCNISGNVTIKEEVFIGSGASILNGVTIHKRSTVGAGAVVTKDVTGNTTVVGVPAKLITH